MTKKTKYKFNWEVITAEDIVNLVSMQQADQNLLFFETWKLIVKAGVDISQIPAGEMSSVTKQFGEELGRLFLSPGQQILGG